MLYFICSALSSEGALEYLIFDSDIKLITSYDHNAVVELIIQHKVENAKLENMVIKAADCTNSVRLEYKDRVRNSVYYIFSLENGILRAVSNTGEIFIMSMNVAAEYFRNKTLLNAVLKGKQVIVRSGKNFNSPLSRDYSHIRTK